MWVYTNFENYLIKQKCLADSNTFYLTDLVKIWVSEHSIQDLTSKFRAQNPLLDMEDTVIMKKIHSLYHKPSTGVVHNIEHNCNVINVFTTGALNKFPIKMHITFRLGQPEVLYTELSKHLFGCMNQLVNREKRLVDIIKSKDAEIEEYKLEGVEIKRRAAITTPFNYEEFENSQNAVDPVVYPSSLIEGPLGELLGRHIQSFLAKTEVKEEATEEPVKKSPKTDKRKFPVFESRGCLYKKDESASSQKRRGKSFKL